MKISVQISFDWNKWGRGETKRLNPKFKLNIFLNLLLMLNSPIHYQGQSYLQKTVFLLKVFEFFPHPNLWTVSSVPQMFLAHLFFILEKFDWRAIIRKISRNLEQNTVPCLGYFAILFTQFSCVRLFSVLWHSNVNCSKNKKDFVHYTNRTRFHLHGHNRIALHLFKSFLLQNRPIFSVAGVKKRKFFVNTKGMRTFN